MVSIYESTPTGGDAKFGWFKRFFGKRTKRGDALRPHEITLKDEYYRITFSDGTTITGGEWNFRDALNDFEKKGYSTPYQKVSQRPSLILNKKQYLDGEVIIMAFESKNGKIGYQLTQEQLLEAIEENSAKYPSLEVQKPQH